MRSQTTQDVAALAVSSAGHVLRTFDPHITHDLILSDATARSNKPIVYAADLAAVAAQVQQFRHLLPHVQPYYAVKCNPDPVLLRFLSLLGVSFDVASSHEMSLIAHVLPPASLPNRTIFANPFKAPAELRAAQSHRISLMTVDSIDEVIKVSKYYPNARVLLRIAVDDTHATCPLSSKFGATLHELPPLLDAIKKYAVRLIGVAFHVGSDCRDGSAYASAIKRARSAFDAAQSAGLPRLKILDIGGGFPGDDDNGDNDNVTFKEIAHIVRQAIDSLFGKDIDVIAEPGRYIVSRAYSLAAQIVQIDDTKESSWCMIADGVFGLFRDVCMLGRKYDMDVLGGGNERQGEWTVCGPYGNAGDVIATKQKLPNVKIGEWLLFRNVGAYTICLATNRSLAPSCEVTYYYRSGSGEEDLAVN